MATNDSGMRNRKMTVKAGNRIPPVMNAAQLVSGAMNQNVDKQRKIAPNKAEKRHVPPNTGKLVGAAQRRLKKMNPTMAGGAYGK